MSQIASTNYESETLQTVPPNKGGQRYPLEDVFKVWFDNKDRIVSSSYGGPSREIYKLSNPRPIYHLELSEEVSNGVSSGPGQQTERQEAQGSDLGDIAVDQISNDFSHLNTHSMGQKEEVSNVDVSFRNGLNGSTNGTLNGSGDHGFGRVSATSKHLAPNEDLLSPLQIEWYYLDAAGHEQGPFNGEMMQDWLSEGYLNPDLRIRRPHQQQFITLKDLCERLQNYVLPFAVPQPAYVPPPPKSEPQTSLPFLNNLNPQISQPLATQLSQSMLGDFLPQDPFASNFGSNFLHNQLQMPSLLLQPLQQHQQHPAIARASGWGLNSGPSTPHAMAPSLASLPLQSQVSPWAAGLTSRVSSPFVGTLEKPSEDSESRIESRIDSRTEPKTEPEPQIPKEEPTVSSRVEVSETREERVPEPSHEPIQEPVREPVSESVPEEAPQQTREPGNNAQTSPVAVKKVVKKMDVKKPAPAPSSQPVVPPWAGKEQVGKPQLTLKEIQALDAEKHEKQRQLEAEARSAEAARAFAAAALEEKAAQETRPSLPSTASWGVPTTGAPVAKTLAEIQKEEAEAARAKVAKATTIVSTPTFASALANSVPKDDGAWTTVASRKPMAKKTSQPVISTTTTATAASPQVLRSVSATRIPTSSNNVSVLEDFIVWARSAMTNLYPTVSKDDLLDIFLALPANGDSSVLIAETIYSSSATMDGRRFAEEFLKRRKRVEQQTGKVTMLEWTAAISSSANKVQTVDEDGWSTSVKGKKKKRAA